jgi:rhodanese-related sulfurtransferase
MTKAIKSNAAKTKQFFADKMASTTRPAEMSHQIEKGEDIAILDVRELKDLKKGHVPGAFSPPRKNGAPWPVGAGIL